MSSHLSSGTRSWDKKARRFLALSVFSQSHCTCLVTLGHGTAVLHRRYFLGEVVATKRWERVILESGYGLSRKTLWMFVNGCCRGMHVPKEYPYCPFCKELFWGSRQNSENDTSFLQKCFLMCNKAPPLKAQTAFWAVSIFPKDNK